MTSSEHSVASLRGVHKAFAGAPALRGIDLEVGAGEVVALLGPNGAGKTTAISVLLGQRRADRGQALLFGREPATREVRRAIGVTPQDAAFPPNLRVGEVIALVRAHFPEPMAAAPLAERFGLSSLVARQTGGLSGGERRRLAVALAFAGSPRAVFLDEPTTGLDVEARREVWRRLAAYSGEGGTVLLTTHYLEEADALATRIVVIDRGSIVATGSPDEIRARIAVKRVRFRAAELPELPGIVRADTDADRHTVHTADADALVTALVSSGVAFSDLEVQAASLEEAFLALTGKS